MRYNRKIAISCTDNNVKNDIQLAFINENKTFHSVTCFTTPLSVL